MDSGLSEDYSLTGNVPSTAKPLSCNWLCQFWRSKSVSLRIIILTPMFDNDIYNIIEHNREAPSGGQDVQTSRSGAA